MLAAVNAEGYPEKDAVESMQYTLCTLKVLCICL